MHNNNLYTKYCQILCNSNTYKHEIKLKHKVTKKLKNNLCPSVYWLRNLTQATRQFPHANEDFRQDPASNDWFTEITVIQSVDCPSFQHQ